MEAWKDFDTKYPDFATEPRNVRLGLAADGFNPFGNLSVETIDVATGLKFNMRAMVLWTINDFLARSSLPGWSGQVLKFKSEFPNKDMKEEFPDWFMKHIRQGHVDNDPGVNESSELFALACGPSQTLISVNSCVVNDVRFVMYSRDERRTTQNSGICLPCPDEEMCYGQLEILKFLYLSFKTMLFRVKWFDTSNKGRKGTQKPNLGGRRAGRLHTRQETWNLGLKAITDKNGPVPIRFEFGDKETLMPLVTMRLIGLNYLGELVRELPWHYLSWRQMSSDYVKHFFRKAHDGKATIDFAKV
ncbi:S-adenosyl-L-methionine-dependent methyltransferases superfamily protein [Tanacetum coccineum]